MEPNYNEDIEIDLKELFFVLLANWGKIFLSALLIAGLAFGYSKFIAVPKYASTAKLYVLSKSTSITSLADIQSGTNLTQDYKVVISGRPVVEQVIRNLNLKDTYDDMCERLKVENPDDTRIINITVTDPDPYTAKRIVDEFAKVSATYIADKMDQDAPSIIENGYVNHKKVSPSTMKNTFIGGMLGGMLAVAIVLIIFFMDDTINTTDDIEKYLGLNSLAVIPLDESEAKKSKKMRKKEKKKIKKEMKRKIKKKR